MSYASKLAKLEPPMQYLVVATLEGVSIVDMYTEAIIFNQSLPSHAWLGIMPSANINVSVVSSTNFVNTAHVIVSYTDPYDSTYYVRIHTANLTDSLSVSVCPDIYFGSNALSQLSSFYDPRSKDASIVLSYKFNLEFIFGPSLANCSKLKYAYVFIYRNSTRISVPTFSIITHATPSHLNSTSNGCFLPIASRSLISFQTSTQVYVFGVNMSSGIINLDDGIPNLIFDASLISATSTIQSVQIFGECFGNFDAPSQMLWLSAVLSDSATGRSSLHLVSLDEFSLHPLGCDLNDADWWKLPSSKRGPNCAVAINPSCKGNQYVIDNSTCGNRTHVITPLNFKPDAITHRMQTAPYNSTSPIYTNLGPNTNTPNLSLRYVHLLFLHSSTNFTIDIYGMQEIACKSSSGSPPVVEEINSIFMAHPPKSVSISDNGQHMFVSFGMKQWELASHQRLLQICTLLNPNNASDPLEQSLSRFNDTCKEQERLPFNAYDYMEYYSQCCGGERCWRYGNYKDMQREDMGTTAVLQPEAASYALRPTIEWPCDAGFFCTGDGARYACPSGYYCPNSGLSTPVKCDYNSQFDTTCKPSGLVVPAPCPDGMVCLSPSSDPIPAPPGFYVAPNDRSVFWKCSAGDWCAMMQYNATTTGSPGNMSCLAGGFCNTTDLLAPNPCFVNATNVQYCPQGTYIPQLCPAGNFCQTPMSIAPCLPTYYCPPGSQVQKLCPAGTYCPNPATSIKCPKGYYCREGFLQPEKCHPFVICNAGTKSEKLAVSGLAFDILIIVILYVIYKVGLVLREKLRNKRAQAKKLQPIVKTELLQGLKQKQFTIEIGFEDMGLVLKNDTKKKVLDGVTGKVRPGRVTAVMGPSGAGKTTFLTTLAGKASYGDRTGTITINGKPEDMTKYKRLMGYVPQEDIMHRELTVKEIIRMNAELRLPSHLSQKEKSQMIQDVIDVLGLWDVRHIIIGDETTRGISGGQRKRVNIAMELVADPTVIFLDEPTSGLDSTSSGEVVSCLRRIADLGLTIVVVLHQPRYEIFQLFHDVLLLGKGGKTVYLGPSDEALPYFQRLGFQCPEHTNPPDFFMDVISGTVACPNRPEFAPEQLFDLWQTNSGKIAASYQQQQPQPKRKPAQPLPRESSGSDPSSSLIPKLQQRKTAGFFPQLLLFIHRAFVQQTRDITGLFLDNALILVAGSVLGALYTGTQYRGPLPPELVDLCPPFISRVCTLPQTDKLNAMGMLVSLAVGFTAITASLRCFGAEKVIFWRESSAGINKAAYFLGKNIAQLGNIALAPIVFLSAFYALTSPRTQFWKYYLILLLLQFCFVGIGYLVSVILTYKNAQLAGVVFTLICGMFGGTNPTLGQLKENPATNFVSSLAPNRWAQEALYVSEVTRYSSIYNITSSLDAWGYDENNVETDLCMLFVLGMGARILALIFMHVLNRDKML